MLVNSKSVLVFGAAAALLVIVGPQSFAASQTTTFTPTANVIHQCNAVTATAMAFGTYTPDAVSPKTANSTIKVKCTKNSPVTIALDKGATPGGTTTTRMMQAGAGKTIEYKLFSDAGYTKNWDDGTSKVSATGVGLGTDLEFTVYGQIPDRQLNSEEGSYSDTVTVTVGY